MIDSEALAKFIDVVQHELLDMETRYSKALAAKQAQMIKDGVANSGRSAFVYQDEARNALRAGGQVVLSQLLRCLTAYGTKLDPDNIVEAKQVLRQRIDLHATVLRSRLLGMSVFHGPHIGAAKDQAELEFNQEAKRVADRMANELDIAAAASRPRTGPTGPTINIHGAVGVVQTGDANQATVHQHVGAEIKVEIAATLKGLLTELGRPENSGLPNRGALTDLVHETIAEAEKPSPNPLKLSSALRTIGETVKFVGTLESTYTGLKPILGALGVHLP